MFGDCKGGTNQGRGAIIEASYSGAMKLTTDQQALLAKRVSDEFYQWLQEELLYQIERMQDSDELDWSYNLNDLDAMSIGALVEAMVAKRVTVD